MPTLPSNPTPTSVQQPSETVQPPGVAAPAAWQKPRLTAYGDLRELTMGPTLGEGESGNPTFLRA